MKIRLITAAAALIMAAGLTASVPAQAGIPRSAAGCNLIIIGKIGACVAVDGTGNFVAFARGGAVLRPGVTAKGGWRIYDTEGQLNLTTLTNYKCAFSVRHPLCWSVWRRIEKHFPVGDRICASFYSGHAIYGPACEMIE